MATIDSLVEATIVGDNDLLLIDQGVEVRKLKKGNLKVDAENVLDANGGSVQDFIDAQLAKGNDRGGFGGKLQAKLVGNVLDAFVYLQGDSTSQADTAWFYQTIVKLGAEYPAYTVLYYRWNDSAKAYGSPSTLQTGTGSNTLHVYNAAQSGQNAYFFQGGRVPALYANRQFDLIISSLGLNGDILNLNESVFHDYMYAGYIMLREYQPNAEIVVTLQNFRLDHEEYCAKATNANMRIAEELGLPVLDFYTPFKLQQINGDITDWMADLTHPNSVGYSMMSDICFSQIINPVKQSVSVQNPLSDTKTNLIRDPYITDWWWENNLPVGVSFSSVTATKDLTIFETNASAMKLVSTSASNGTVTWDLTRAIKSVLPNQDLVFMARVFVPSSNASGTASRLSFNTNLGSINTFPESSARDGWLWKIVTLPYKMIKGATYLNAIMFMGATGETVYVDRVCVMPSGHLANPSRPNIALKDYYSPANVRQTATNVVSVSGNDVTIVSSSEVSPTPSFDLDVFNLSSGSVYKVTWVNHATSGNVFAKKDSGGGSTVIAQVAITTNELQFTAQSASATLRFFVDSASVPVTTNDLKIIKLYSQE